MVQSRLQLFIQAYESKSSKDVIFDNFKISPDFDWSVATDGTHPFSGKAQQDYCDREKKLFSIVIPGEQA